MEAPATHSRKRLLNIKKRNKKNLGKQWWNKIKTLLLLIIFSFFLFCFTTAVISHIKVKNMNWFIKNEISAERMKQAAGTAAKSRRDTHSSSAFSLSPAVPFSLTPTEMWIDGHPPGNSVICCPPPFAPLGEKKRRRNGIREVRQLKWTWRKYVVVSAGQLTENASKPTFLTSNDQILLMC